MNGMDIPLSDRPGHPFIALGLIDDAEAERKERGGKVWAPLLVSLSVHFGIGWWLVTTAEDSTIAPRPADDKIVLRLVPPVPQVSEASVAAPAAVRVEPEIVEVAPDRPAEPPALPPSPSSPSLPCRPLVDVPVVRASAAVPDASRPVASPSTLTLRQVVEDTMLRQEQHNPGFSCSPLRLENEMLNCSNRLDERFENIPESNATVEFFDRSPTPSRLQNAARISEAGVAEIGTNLRAAGINNDSIDRLMNQLESIAREYAAPQNQKTRILENQMLSSDPVWQQRNRAMNPR